MHHAGRRPAGEARRRRAPRGRSPFLLALTSALFDRDFTAEGHTMERLGLAGLGRDGILRVAREGFAP